MQLLGDASGLANERKLWKAKGGGAFENVRCKGLVLDIVGSTSAGGETRDASSSNVSSTRSLVLKKKDNGFSQMWNVILNSAVLTLAGGNSTKTW